MEDQVLSIEQMQELNELGIDTFKASMCWIDDRASIFLDCNYQSYTEEDKLYLNIIPTFTLQDILLLFKPLNGQWKLVDYGEGFEFDYFAQNICFSNQNILEAAFNMLKWCKQNNYI